MRIEDPDGNVLRIGSDREDLGEYDAR